MSCQTERFHLSTSGNVSRFERSKRNTRVLTIDFMVSLRSLNDCPFCAKRAPFKMTTTTDNSWTRTPTQSWLYHCCTTAKTSDRDKDREKEVLHQRPLRLAGQVVISVMALGSSPGTKTSAA